MIAKVNGKQIDLLSITYRGINYGQFVPEMREVLYELMIPLSDFISAVKNLYEEYGEDDLLYLEENEEPTILALRALGWPSLNSLLIKQKDLLATFIRKHLAYLSLILVYEQKAPNANSPLYLINSVDAVSIDHDCIFFTGKALVQKE